MNEETSLWVYNERDYRIRVEILETDGRYRARANWINEKLLYLALLKDLWVEDFSESYLGKTARGPRGPNYPPGCPNLALCPIGFAERIG